MWLPTGALHPGKRDIQWKDPKSRAVTTEVTYFLVMFTWVSFPAARLVDGGRIHRCAQGSKATVPQGGSDHLITLPYLGRVYSFRVSRGQTQVLAGENRIPSTRRIPSRVMGALLGYLLRVLERLPPRRTDAYRAEAGVEWVEASRRGHCQEEGVRECRHANTES